MRSQNNIKSFGHASKSKGQKDGYKNMVQGRQKRGSTVEDNFSITKFESTNAVSGKRVKSKTNTPKKVSQKPPYVSWRTRFAEYQFYIVGGIITVVLVPFAVWLHNNTQDNTTDIKVQDSKIEGIQSDVETLQKDVKTINERSIKSESLIESIGRYFDGIGFKPSTENEE